MSGSPSNDPELPEWARGIFGVPPPTRPNDLLRAMAVQPSADQLTQPQEKSPLLKLQDCIIFGRKIIETNKADKFSILQWTKRVRHALFLLFGKESSVVKNLDSLVKEAQTKGLSQDQFSEKLTNVESLSNYLNRAGAYPLALPVSLTSQTPSTKNIFIIHGHDELNTRRLSQLLQGHFGLNPIAMISKPGMSRPLTDKFEDEAQTCSFAFALFTPDDEVSKLNESYKQARPNVIYEVGWFIGRLGRERVCLILKSGTKIHSDLDGVSQIRFSENVEDKFLEIQNELKAAKIFR